MTRTSSKGGSCPGGGGGALKGGPLCVSLAPGFALGSSLWLSIATPQDVESLSSLGAFFFLRLGPSWALQVWSCNFVDNNSPFKNVVGFIQVFLLSQFHVQ